MNWSVVNGLHLRNARERRNGTSKPITMALGCLAQGHDDGQRWVTGQPLFLHRLFPPSFFLGFFFQHFPFFLHIC